MKEGFSSLCRGELPGTLMLPLLPESKASLIIPEATVAEGAWEAYRTAKGPICYLSPTCFVT